MHIFVMFKIIKAMSRKKQANSGLYQTNKDAKVNEQIECPVCHKKFIKRQYSQAFCCGHCKDKFWNQKEPDRHSAMWYHKQSIRMDRNYIKYADRYDDDTGMTDRDWDDAFGVAEYND